MKLTVDASIVAKWFLTEPQSEEARRLLAPRIRLHAPDVVPDPADAHERTIVPGPWTKDTENAENV